MQGQPRYYPSSIIEQRLNGGVQGINLPTRVARRELQRNGHLHLAVVARQAKAAAEATRYLLLVVHAGVFLA